MPKLLPILMPVEFTSDELFHIPDFSGLPCDVVYNVARQEYSPIPAENIAINAFAKNHAPVKMEFETTVERLSAEFGYCKTLVTTGIDKKGLKLIFRGAGKIALGNREYMQDLYTHFLTRSMVQRGHVTGYNNPTGPIRIVMGDGYAFYLVGDRHSVDPLVRFGSIDTLNTAHPELGTRIEQLGITADLFVSVTVWGDKTISSHGRLAFSRRMTRDLPRACAGIEGYEMLAPLWHEALPAP